MDVIVEWPPVVWTARVVMLIVVGGAGYVALLFLMRFFRWTVIRNMARAYPPSIESLGGEFAGAKAEVKLGVQDRQLLSIEDRLLNVEEGHVTLVKAVRKLRNDFLKTRRSR